MRPFTLIFIAILFVTGCNKTEPETGSISSGGIDFEGIPMVFGEVVSDGSSDGIFRCIVLPTFDWVNKDGGLGGGGSKTIDGVSVSYGYRKDLKNHRWDWKFSKDKAWFGEQEFLLSEGEVFILEKNYNVIQIKDSIAGKNKDKANYKRLKAIYDKHLSNKSQDNKSIKSANKSQ